MKIFVGKVVSTKLEKTATVAVDRVVVHPVYKKRYKKTKKYQVHAEEKVNIGDVVKFVACKPFSKTKKWVILKDKKNKKVEKDTKKDVNEKTKKGKVTKE